MTWLIWAVLLLAQNGSATWVSRARNSRSLGYHALASVFSNGVWIVSLGFAIDKLPASRSNPWLFAATVAFYVACTVTGSVGAHHLLMSRVERGARKVG